MKQNRRDIPSAWHDQGTDLSRIVSLSDALFAFALTLLAADIGVPALSANIVTTELPRAIFEMIPQIVVYVIAFYLVIVKWMAHRRIFEHVTRYDSTLVWLNNMFLLFIAFMPVPTAILGDYPTQPAALIFFGVVQIITTLVQWALWAYITNGRRYIDQATDDELVGFFNRRYFMQVLALAGFTILALLNTWIALISLVVIGLGFQVVVALQRSRHAETGEG